jgi:methyl-accepting chemotaxis protein
MRMLGWLLICYAAAGALLLVATLAVGGPLMTRAEQLAGSATGSMGSAATAARAAADAFDGFDASLTQAQASTADAAAISRDTSRTLRSLADAMSLSIFGNQPLLPLADEFATSAGQLQQMGDNLEGIGQALAANQADVAALAVELRVLADELNELRGTVEREGDERDSTPSLRWLLYGFAAWQLLAVAAAAVAGGILLRRTR